MGMSLWGMAGAAIGLCFGLLNYRVIVTVVEARLRAVDTSHTSEERRLFENKLVLLRRIILAVEVVVLTGGGYFIGTMLGDWFGG